MLNLTTALGRNGLQDWLLQRVSAVLLAIYCVFVFGFWLFHPLSDHSAWWALFSSPWMCDATFLAMVSLVIHAWIGVWTVVTDYVHSAWLRLILLVLVFITLLCEIIWCVQILWGQ